ncbi:MAG: phosphatidylserine decarboxylase [Deltaproteobacteria bacterium RIFCSPLOWO2_12_FULL_57_22]|nr:MAG: phosphatidylserine decarboxylase [Deltaproteobacteria bacterium RIFCSPLOWO2_12_FULL_57_22]
MRIAKEGYRFVFSSALLALLALIVGWKWVALGLGLITLAFAGFFRDPERSPPEGEGLILSAADGKVVSIKKIEGNKVPEGGGTRVSVFLSPLDVHINRAPIRGSVEEVTYRKGRFLAAFKEEASSSNERNALRIVDSQGRRLGVVQIAGVLARRIVCYVKPGDSLERGQKLGMIMFGSRVDLFLPERSRVEVVQGQKVKAGESVIGRLL